MILILTHRVILNRWKHEISGVIAYLEHGRSSILDTTIITVTSQVMNWVKSEYYVSGPQEGMAPGRAGQRFCGIFHEGFIRFLRSA